MALHAVSSVEAGRSECSLPGETVEYPDQAECPPYSRVAAQRLPVEEQVQAYLLAGDQSGKDDEHGGACIVGELEEDYLGCYARGREVRECTRPWRAASAGHECTVSALVVWLWHVLRAELVWRVLRCVMRGFKCWRLCLGGRLAPGEARVGAEISRV